MERCPSRRGGGIFLLIFLFALIASCSKDDEQGLDKIEITPVPESPSPSPVPAPKAGMPLDPLEVWCESMMAKANQEWTKEDAVKFSDQCLYNE